MWSVQRLYIFNAVIAQGVRTLWGSFEIPTHRLAGSLFTMYLGGTARAGQLLGPGQLSAVPEGVVTTPSCPASSDPESVESASSVEAELWGDFVRDVPMSMMSFHGSTSLSTVLETMQHACYTDDVTHIILDNLQFMLSGQRAGACLHLCL